MAEGSIHSEQLANAIYCYLYAHELVSGKISTWPRKCTSISFMVYKQGFTQSYIGARCLDYITPNHKFEAVMIELWADPARQPDENKRAIARHFLQAKYPLELEGYLLYKPTRLL